MNLASAIFGVCTLVWLQALLQSLLQASMPDRPALLPSLLSVLGLGLGHTFWFHSVVPEVYTLQSLILVGILYLVLVRAPGKPWSSWTAACFLFGL